MTMVELVSTVSTLSVGVSQS